MPGNGLIVSNAQDENLNDVIERGCWTKRIEFAGAQGAWQAELVAADGSHFKVGERFSFGEGVGLTGRGTITEIIENDFIIKSCSQLFYFNNRFSFIFHANLTILQK